MSDDFFDKYNLPVEDDGDDRTVILNGADAERPDPATAVFQRQENPEPEPAPELDFYDDYVQPQRAVNSIPEAPVPESGTVEEKPVVEDDSGDSRTVIMEHEQRPADPVGDARTVTTNPQAFVMPPFSAPAPAPVQSQQPQNAGHEDIRDGYYHAPYGAYAPSANQPVNPYGAHAAVPDKKSKKKKSGSGIAFILVICILVSLVAGFGGSILGNYVLKPVEKKSSEEEESSFKVNMVDTEAMEYDELTDKPTTAITAEVADTVVEITTESIETSSFYGQYISQGAGSGVIISDDGYILTNNHVIEGATSITVTTRSGDVYEGSLVGTDSEVDIALLKIEATGLPKATLGDSSKLKVGSKAVIIGNPLGTLGGSVTEGIISALDRSIAIDGKTMHLMQTDAAINPGNSGGGMFDGQGLLSGIVVAKSSSEEIDNIGFVIPINNVKQILGDLKDYGYVRGRAATGMEFMDMNNPMFAWYYFRSTETGVFITAIENGSNAQMAGFQQGDRIISVDGQSISTSDDIATIISSKSAGDSVTFEISRNGNTKTLNLTLQEYVPEGINTGSNRGSSGSTN